MSFGSKRTLASLTAGFVLFAAYISFALGSRAPEAENVKSWAIVMMIFIGIGVLLIVIIQILFHIVFSIGISVKHKEYEKKEISRIISSSTVEDERDKLISLKSTHMGYIVAGIGFIAFLAALAFGLKTVYAMHILFGGCGLASSIEGILSIYYYEKGISNG